MSLAETFEAHCGVATQLATEIANLHKAVFEAQPTIDDWAHILQARNVLRDVAVSLVTTVAEIDERRYATETAA